MGRWFVEFKVPPAHSLNLDALSLTGDLLRAFSRYLDGQNARTCCWFTAVNPEGIGDRHAVLITDFDCSEIAHLSGTYRVLKHSAFRSDTKIATHKSEVRIFPCNPDKACAVKTEKRSARPGGGGGSPKTLKAIADSGFSIELEGYRDGDEAIAVDYLQSRSRIGDALPLVFRARLHPVEQFYCCLNEKALTLDQYNAFFDVGFAAL